MSGYGLGRMKVS